MRITKYSAITDVWDYPRSISGESDTVLNSDIPDKIVPLICYIQNWCS